MSAIDVLARALFATARPKASWDVLTEPVQDEWRGQAQVIAGQMLEAEPAAAADPAPDGLPAAVQAVLAAAEALNATGLAAISDTDWKDAIRHLATLREASDHIGAVTSLLTTHVYLTGEHGDQDIPGLGRVKIARARDRKDWDARGAAYAYLEAKMRERGGEAVEPEEVVAWVLDIAGVSYCRVTPLRAAGLDPKEFCTDLPGKIGVQLPAR